MKMPRSDMEGRLHQLGRWQSQQFRRALIRKAGNGREAHPTLASATFISASPSARCVRRANISMRIRALGLRPASIKRGTIHMSSSNSANTGRASRPRSRCPTPPPSAVSVSPTVLPARSATRSAARPASPSPPSTPFSLSKATVVERHLQDHSTDRRALQRLPNTASTVSGAMPAPTPCIIRTTTRLHEVGDFGLNGRFPPKTFYSLIMSSAVLAGPARVHRMPSTCSSPDDAEAIAVSQIDWRASSNPPQPSVTATAESTGRGD